MHFRPFSGSFIPFFRISNPDFKPFKPCLRPHKHKERVWQNFATPSLQYSLLKFSKWFKYGLKAQKLLAQGIALGIKAINKASCKGKSLSLPWSFKAFALTGRQICVHKHPGRCPGLGASALSTGVWGLLAKLEFYNLIIIQN